VADIATVCCAGCTGVESLGMATMPMTSDCMGACLPRRDMVVD
jgi:hypothetical protein